MFFLFSDSLVADAFVQCQNQTFGDALFVMFPMHENVNALLQSSSDDGWQRVDDARFDSGHAINNNQFLQIRSIWPEEGHQRPIRCIPFWHGTTSRLIVLAHHALGCEMCDTYNEHVLSKSPWMGWLPTKKIPASGIILIIVISLRPDSSGFVVVGEQISD